MLLACILLNKTSRFRIKLKISTTFVELDLRINDEKSIFTTCYGYPQL